MVVCQGSGSGVFVALQILFKKPPGEGEYITLHGVVIKPLMTTSPEIQKIKLAATLTKSGQFATPLGRRI